MVVGYFVGGTGITVGTTIQSVDSATQITMSANATSTGSGTVQVSPWALGDGTTTFNIPNTKTSGRYRRSRTSVSAARVGVSQNDAVLTHTHTIPASTYATGLTNVSHTHAILGTTDVETGTHGHTYNEAGVTVSVAAGGAFNVFSANGPATTGNQNASHTHGITITSQPSASLDHQHTIPTMTSSTSSLAASTETRPLTLIVLTCIKT